MDPHKRFPRSKHRNGDFPPGSVGMKMNSSLRVVVAEPSLQDMNLALVHDRLLIKTFWEQRINTRSQHDEVEEQRRNKSALNKLRQEWLVRLESRTKHLKNLNDSFIRKAKVEQSADQT